MIQRSCALALLLLAAPSAAEPVPLVGVGRVAPSVGWRHSSNGTFYDNYYSQPGRAGTRREPSSPGGPVLAITFGYGVTSYFELGVDLFATAERLRLTGEPQLTTATYGALVAGRFQTLIESVGPAGLVPSLGLLTGPTLVLTQVPGGTPNEVFTQAWGAAAGVRLPLDTTWSVGLEYRFLFVRGNAGTLGSVNGGGQWLTLGLSYAFPPEPEHSFGL